MTVGHGGLIGTRSQKTPSIQTETYLRPQELLKRKDIGVNGRGSSRRDSSTSYFYTTSLISVLNLTSNSGSPVLSTEYES